MNFDYILKPYDDAMAEYLHFIRKMDELQNWMVENKVERYFEKITRYYYGEFGTTTGWGQKPPFLKELKMASELLKFGLGNTEMEELSKVLNLKQDVEFKASSIKDVSNDEDIDNIKVGNGEDVDKMNIMILKTWTDRYGLQQYLEDLIHKQFTFEDLTKIQDIKEFLDRGFVDCIPIKRIAHIFSIPYDEDRCQIGRWLRKKSWRTGEYLPYLDIFVRSQYNTLRKISQIPSTEQLPLGIHQKHQDALFKQIEKMKDDYKLKSWLQERNKGKYYEMMLKKFKGLSKLKKINNFKELVTVGMTNCHDIRMIANSLDIQFDFNTCEISVWLQKLKMQRYTKHFVRSQYNTVFKIGKISNIQDLEGIVDNPVDRRRMFDKLPGKSLQPKTDHPEIREFLKNWAPIYADIFIKGGYDKLKDLYFIQDVSDIEDLGIDKNEANQILKQINDKKGQQQAKQIDYDQYLDDQYLDDQYDDNIYIKYPYSPNHTLSYYNQYDIFYVFFYAFTLLIIICFLCLLALCVLLCGAISGSLIYQNDNNKNHGWHRINSDQSMV